MEIQVYCKHCQDEENNITPRMDPDGPLCENERGDQSQNYRCWCCNWIVLVVVKGGKSL